MSVDESPDARLQRLRADQVRRWQSGDRVSVEDYLRSEPELGADPDAVLDLLYGEMLLREERGELLESDAFVERFPDLADSIRRQLDFHAALPSDKFDDATLEVGSRDVDSHDATASGTGGQVFPSIPDYEVEEELGRGGMGVVYKAQHTRLRRTVALKMIRDGALADATLLARFRAEAEAVARLHHPNIVQIYDCFEHHGRPCLSLEYVSGGNLESWTREPLHSVSQCVAMVEAIAQAIAYAHQEQIVHRDLKPANILLAPPESQQDATPDPERDSTLACRPKVTDFGLAKQWASDSDLTQSKAFLGTGAYMSPEQAWGDAREAGPPTDVHALGVMLYELITGEAPFREESLIKTLDRVRFEEARPPSLLRPEVPPTLDVICLRCLRKEPAERYATAEELAADLRRFLNGESLDGTPTPRGTDRRATTLYSLAVACLVFLFAMVGSAIYFASRTKPTISETEQAEGGMATTVRTNPEPFAFLVGVSTYQSEDQQIQLAYTESDVNELSRLLLKKGYQRKNIHLLTQWSEADNPDLAPTASNIRKQLRKMLRACIPEDTVLVAVTGLGGDAGSRGAYCYLPADADVKRPESFISLAEFYDMFRECPAKQKLLLVDTCQTVDLPQRDWPEAVLPSGTAALFACSPDEASYEHPQLRHGVFSYHVMRAFEGAADSDGDGRITLAELHSFTRARVQSFLDEFDPGAVQTPMLIVSTEGEGFKDLP